MKKKLLAAGMVAALATTAVVGGTLAYFTDADAETNTFTIGNIDIDLEEDFVQESQLLPGKDVNKDAWIINEGTNDAWVWAEVLIPSALDDGDDNSPAAPGLGNSLHVNYLGKYAKEYAQNSNADGKFYNENLSQLWIMQYNADDVSYGYVGTETVNGVEYNKFIKFYTEKLAAGASTSSFLDNVYMDSKVTQCDNDDCTTERDHYVLADGATDYSGTWDIIVRAYGMQAEGFENTVDDNGNITEYGVIKAWKAYDGEEPAQKEAE